MCEERREAKALVQISELLILLREGKFDPSLTLTSVVKETFQAVQSG